MNGSSGMSLLRTSVALGIDWPLEPTMQAGQQPREINALPRWNDHGERSRSRPARVVLPPQRRHLPTQRRALIADGRPLRRRGRNRRQVQPCRPSHPDRVPTRDLSTPRLPDPARHSAQIDAQSRSREGTSEGSRHGPLGADRCIEPFVEQGYVAAHRDRDDTRDRTAVGRACGGLVSLIAPALLGAGAHRSGVIPCTCAAALDAGTITKAATATVEPVPHLAQGHDHVGEDPECRERSNHGGR
jgi:hypothetical protein